MKAIPVRGSLIPTGFDLSALAATGLSSPFLLFTFSLPLSFYLVNLAGTSSSSPVSLLLHFLFSFYTF